MKALRPADSATGPLLVEEDAQLGEVASGADVGDEICGVNDWFSGGATTEYCVAHHSTVAPSS
jgi:hypothetical protein